MAQNEIALMAHLMRRAGFGATRDELERYVAKGYEATVEELLRPVDAPAQLEDEDLMTRYHIGLGSKMLLPAGQHYWMYRMIHTDRPLEEKIALFWHQILPTGYTKLNQPKQILKEIDMYRQYGMGSFHTLLLQLSKDPAMLFYLDNKDSHKDAVNENYGRELLELFSMGVGNYTEVDVRQASRAFTGWTLRNASLHAARVAQDSVEPYARLDWQFEYRDEDHDDGEKTFLGHTGNFNGEDIINIICEQEAAARFVSRHMYNFFVADEPQVPAWETVEPRDPQAIKTLMDTYFSSKYEIRSMLRVLFNSDFFKNAAFAKVKSPTELVVGSVRMSGGLQFPEVGDDRMAVEAGDMGQQLLDPPSVEGWHTGNEWITTGSLVSRVNFASGQFADTSKPGVNAIINGIKDQGASSSPEKLVDAVLDLMGPLSLSDATRGELVDHAKGFGELRFGTEKEASASAERIKELLQLVVATREYQLA